MSKTVTAFFKGRVGVCESLYQYDYGRILILDNIELESPFDAYYETSESVEAIPVIGQNKMVAIPNECLSKSGVVTLHIPIHEGQNDSEVEYIVYFKVIGRARPIDDEDPSQLQTAVSKAIALLQHPNYVLENRIRNLQANKINKPVDSDNLPYDGEQGQLLRTNGDGTTEWTDDGLPTDEQTLAAVAAWLAEHPEATTTVEDGSITYDKLSSSLKKYIVAVNPDQFSGTDTAKLQAAFDACINGGAIILNREYTLDSDIVIKTNSDYSRYIHVYGMGNMSTINMGNYSFVGDEYPAGNVYFHNVHFKGDETGDAFLCQSLVRIFFHTCTFVDFNNCFYSGVDDEHILQTIHVIGCFFRGIKEAVFKSETSTFDVRMDHCAVEWSKSVIKNVHGNGGSNQNLTISHCSIEGMSGVCFTLNQCFGCSIHDNYFETNEGYFDLQNTAGSIGLRIENNLFIDRDADKGIILLPKVTNNVHTLFIVNNSLMFPSNNFVYQDPEYNAYIRGVILANNGNAQYSADIRRNVYIANDGTDYVDDFDDCIFEGTYQNGGGDKDNAPSEKYGLLTVFSRGADGLQLYATYDNELYYRKRNGNEQYTNWKAINPGKQAFTITSVSDAVVQAQRCYKKGNTVVINALISNTTALGSGEVEVASIPSDCTPSESVLFNCEVGLYGYVSSSGKICFNHSGETTGYTAVNVIYDL